VTLGGAQRDVEAEQASGPARRENAGLATGVWLGVADLAVSVLVASAGRSSPSIRRWALWAVGGHSLGGVVAAQDAAAAPGRMRGLVLWAAYPVSSLAGRLDLPLDTRYAVIDGAVHAAFGDYGEQPGDGIPTPDRAGVRHQNARATIDLLDRLARP
jgi:pimeloyl-ACP methyl ester carboxylesterase